MLFPAADPSDAFILLETAIRWSRATRSPARPAQPSTWSPEGPWPWAGEMHPKRLTHDVVRVGSQAVPVIPYHVDSVQGTLNPSSMTPLPPRSPVPSSCGHPTPPPLPAVSSAQRFLTRLGMRSTTEVPSPAWGGPPTLRPPVSAPPTTIRLGLIKPAPAAPWVLTLQWAPTPCPPAWAPHHRHRRHSPRRKAQRYCRRKAQRYRRPKALPHRQPRYTFAIPEADLRANR